MFDIYKTTGDKYPNRPKKGMIVNRIILITARKRSLQGYVFTPVCQSFCSQGGGLHPEGSAYRGVQHPAGICIQGGLHPGGLHRGGGDLHPGGGVGQTPSDTTGYGQRAGGTHPTGMHSCSLFLQIQIHCRRCQRRRRLNRQDGNPWRHLLPLRNLQPLLQRVNRHQNQHFLL